jgi:hypothetical protein
VRFARKIARAVTAAIRTLADPIGEASGWLADRIVATGKRLVSKRGRSRDAR